MLQKAGTQETCFLPDGYFLRLVFYLIWGGLESTAAGSASILQLPSCKELPWPVEEPTWAWGSLNRARSAERRSAGAYGGRVARRGT